MTVRRPTDLGDTKDKVQDSLENWFFALQSCSLFYQTNVHRTGEKVARIYEKKKNNVGFRIPKILFSEVNCKEKSAEILYT